MNNSDITVLSETTRMVLVGDAEDIKPTHVILSNEVTDHEAQESWVTQAPMRIELLKEGKWVEAEPLDFTEEFYDTLHPLVQAKHAEVTTLKVAGLSFKQLYTHVPITAHRIWRRKLNAGE